MNYLLVGIGGMLGSILRYAISVRFLDASLDTKLPVATLAVNLIGCLLIGIFSGLISKIEILNTDLRLLCITGFLGGFTTFSAFGIETFNLIKNGELLLALGYVAISVVVGVGLVAVGAKLVS